MPFEPQLELRAVPVWAHFVEEGLIEESVDDDGLQLIRVGFPTHLEEVGRERVVAIHLALFQAPLAPFAGISSAWLQMRAGGVLLPWLALDAEKLRCVALVQGESRRGHRNAVVVAGDAAEDGVGAKGPALLPRKLLETLVYWVVRELLKWLS